MRLIRQLDRFVERMSVRQRAFFMIAWAYFIYWLTVLSYA